MPLPGKRTSACPQMLPGSPPSSAAGQRISSATLSAAWSGPAEAAAELLGPLRAACSSCAAWPSASTSGAAPEPAGSATVAGSCCACPCCACCCCSATAWLWPAAAGAAPAAGGADEAVSAVSLSARLVGRGDGCCCCCCWEEGSGELGSWVCEVKASCGGDRMRWRISVQCLTSPTLAHHIATLALTMHSRKAGRRSALLLPCTRARATLLNPIALQPPPCPHLDQPRHHVINHPPH